ncbi:MAG: M3 family oligoendopeptidase [Bacteroidia bacterium]|nr:M3 family oligoendopeptidase [Bacteroidia bacterium]
MSEITFKKPVRAKRKFVAENLAIRSFDDVRSYFGKLESQQLTTADELLQWLNNRSELETVLQEHAGWLYIRMSCDTRDKIIRDAYTFFINEIQPHVSVASNRLNDKLLNSGLAQKVSDKRFRNYFRQVENHHRIFREENVALIAKLQTTEQQYAAIVGEMSITYKDKEYTMPAAANFLRNPDRNVREEIFSLIVNRRMQDTVKLNDLFSELVKLRHSIAVNAGFANYRDYRFVELDRQYSVSDCEKFHDAITKTIVPLCKKIDEERKRKLGYESLKPWDTEVDAELKPDLKPFADGVELEKKTVECFKAVNPKLQNAFSFLHELNRLDLDSRMGKAPGGYNYPLYETGVPFIFMNASGSLRDVVTLVHEGGHAFHSLLTHELGFIGFKEFPSEVAELASMSMELITMGNWNVYFSSEEELKRAKRTHLEDILKILPWIALIDKFQHWIYTHPQHTSEERMTAWTELQKQFSTGVADWNGFEDYKSAIWQKQLHLFEVPFYYIEYGIAQLGAIAVWKNFRENPLAGLEKYLSALSLGYTASMSEIYSTAGIRFDFSEEYINELSSFLTKEISAL